MSLIKYLLKEIQEDDIPWELYEKKDELMREMIMEIHEDETGELNQDWVVANFNRIQRIWKQYMELGFIRDKKGMEKISELFIENILKIINNTEIAGHTAGGYPIDELVALDIAEDYEEARRILNDDWDEKIYNYIFDHEQGQMRISDYALDKLGALAYKLDKAINKFDHEEMLQVCDRILNVIHRRSDIAKWFVRGGVANLDRLFEE